MNAPTTTAPVRTPRRTAAVSRANPLVGTATLIRLILRRDRIRLLLWSAGLTVTGAGFVGLFEEAFATDTDIATRIALLQGNPAGVLFTGPGYGLEDASVDDYGPLIVNELGGTMIVLFALMALFLTVRYTRTEEETGRAELVRAGTVARHAPLTAALLVMTGLHLLIGTLIALGLAAQGLDWAGSWAFGLGMALLGIVITAIAAVCAQITESGRGAAGLAGLVFGVLYMVRAVGDMQDNDLTWASPVGWAQGVRAFADEQWWPLVYLLGLALFLAAVAYLLNGRRDLDAALFRVRPGRPAATALLSGSFGLAARLQRGTFIVWALVMTAAGGIFGGLLASEAAALTEMDIYQQVLALAPDADPAAQMLAFYLLFIMLVAACYSVQAILRAHTEEASGRAEPVLAKPVSRRRWAGGHLLISLLGTAVILAATGLALGLGSAAETGTGDDIATYTLAALGYFPAMAVVIGLAFALLGVLPRWTPLAWVPVGYAFLVAMFGLLLEMPEWAMDLSPFTHIPEVPAEDYAAAPALWLGGVALVLIAVGFLGLSRRDVQSN